MQSWWDGTVHFLWPVTFCPKAGANLLFLTCKLLQGNKISSDHQNNIMVNILISDIILDPQTKTCNGWVTAVDFLWDYNHERAVSATALPKKNINDLHIELGHPAETITHSTAKAWYPSHQDVQTMWRLCLGKSQATGSQKKGCTLIKNFSGKAFLWCKLPIYS